MSGAMARMPSNTSSIPVLVKAGKGMIDATPLWDEDGKVYLIHAYAGSRSGVNSILVICELNPEGTEVISDPVMAVSYTHLIRFLLQTVTIPAIMPISAVAICCCKKRRLFPVTVILVAM